jgi:hypothetical protein
MNKLENVDLAAPLAHAVFGEPLGAARYKLI